MLSNYWLFVILFAGMLLSVLWNKLTIPAALTGGAIATFIFAGAGYTGLAMLALFFTLGSAATSWKSGLKIKIGLAETNKGKRTAGQVLANGGLAAITGLLVLLYPANTNIFLVMMAASLASATADTMSSELGTVYGKKFYNTTTLKKDKRGLDGVISIEGTVIGIVGSIFIAFIYALGFGWNLNVAWIVVSGTIGNMADSILGATLERKNYLQNNAVNFLNTLIASIAAFLLCFV